MTLKERAINKPSFFSPSCLPSYSNFPLIVLAVVKKKLDLIKVRKGFFCFFYGEIITEEGLGRSTPKLWLTHCTGIQNNYWIERGNWRSPREGLGSNVSFSLTMRQPSVKSQGMRKKKLSQGNKKTFTKGQAKVQGCPTSPLGSDHPP